MLRPSDDSPTAIVIGGGLAGLTAALHLAERGLSVTLLEADPDRLGGRLSGALPTTFTQDDTTYTFYGEHGIHGVWGQYHNVRALLERLDIDPGYRLAAREAWVLRTLAGRIRWAEGGSALRRSWVPAPFHYLALFVRPRFLQMLTLRDLASMFRVIGGLLFALAYDPATEGAPLRGRTLADYFRGWSPTLRALFTGLARNFASEKPENVPESGFIAFLRFYTLLRRDSWAFSYFKRDSGQAVIAPLEAKLHDLGVQIHLDTCATELYREADGWRVRSASQTDFTARFLVFALDSPAARTLLTASPETSPLAESLRWPQAIPTAVMRFWFRTTPALMAEAGILTGSFTLDNFFWLHRFQDDFAAWHAQTRGCAVECHIYGPSDLFAEPDAVLLARGLVDLTRVWPGLRGALLHQTLRRNPAAHTLFDSDGDQLGVSTPWVGAAACGDWVRYPHPSLYLERATVTGIAAANHILHSAGLESFPIQAATPPEPLARWIQAGLRRIRRAARARKSKMKGGKGQYNAPNLFP